MTYSKQITNRDIFGKSMFDILNEIKEGKKATEEAHKLLRAQSEARKRPKRESKMETLEDEEEFENMLNGKRKLTKEQIRIKETHALYL